MHRHFSLIIGDWKITNWWLYRWRPHVSVKNVAINWHTWDPVEFPRLRRWRELFRRKPAIEYNHTFYVDARGRPAGEKSETVIRR